MGKPNKHLAHSSRQSFRRSEEGQTFEDLRAIAALPLPPSLFVMPLYKTLVFPGVIIPQLIANDEQLMTLLAIKDNGVPLVGLFGAKPHVAEKMTDVSSPDDIYSVGVVGAILDISIYNDSRRDHLPTGDVYQVLIYPLRRIQLTGPAPSQMGEFRVAAEERPDLTPEEDSNMLLSRSLQIRSLCLDLARERLDPGLSMPIMDPGDLKHYSSVVPLIASDAWHRGAWKTREKPRWAKLFQKIAK